MSNGGVRPRRWSAVGWAVAVAAALVAGAVVGARPASAAAAPPPWTCGFSNTLEEQNPPAQLRAGTASLYGRMVDIAGDIDWLTYDDPTTRLWLQSLKWLEPLLLTGDPDDLALARSLVDRWAKDNAGGSPADPYGWTEHAVGLRATTLACLAAVLPPTTDHPVLEAAIQRHIAALSDPAEYAGRWNHGLVQDVGLLALGCAQDDANAVGVATSRLSDALPVVVDSQGVSNEQAPTYQSYSHTVLSMARAAWTACSPRPLDPLFARVDLMPDVLAHSVRPDGLLAALGDTVGGVGNAPPGSTLEYAMTGGQRGTRPDRRVAVYDAGYVFARSGWGTDRAFAAEDFWSLRFGPGRIIHGHNDHTSITTFGRGRPLIVDSGFAGYAPGTMRDHLRSPQAHSMTVIPGARYRWDATTSLVRQRITEADETFAVRDEPYAGVTRTRTVFAAHDLPVMLVIDRSTARTPVAWEQLWHVHPDLRPSGTSPYSARFRSTSGTTSLSVSSIPWPGSARSAVGVVEGQQSPLLGWFAEGGAPRPAPVARFTTRGTEQFQIALLVPTRPGARVSWSISPYGTTRAVVTVRIDGAELRLRIDRASGWIARR